VVTVPTRQGQPGPAPELQGGALQPYQLAAYVGWTTRRTVYRRLADTRGKVRQGQSLLPTDLPVPSRYYGRTPVWDLDVAEKFRRARESTHPRAGRTSPSRTRPMAAEQVERGDVLISGDGRLAVVDVDRRHPAGVRLMVSDRLRAPGRWLEPIQPGREVLIFR